jgi:hypothetical protein
LVLRDALEGKVSVQRAREDYGVAIDTGTWTIDPVESEKLLRLLERRKGNQ